MIIELKQSSHGGPPGAKGMHTQKHSLWLRIDGGGWIRVDNTQSIRMAKIDILATLGVECDHPRTEAHGMRDRRVETCLECHEVVL